MHVLQLFHFFLLAAQIEVVETTLPEPTAEFAIVSRRETLSFTAWIIFEDRQSKVPKFIDVRVPS